MNKKLEEIHKLLPDNINGDITEGNVRECFTKTFAYADEVKGISEAPKDNKQYARKNGAWEEITASGGAEAPTPKINIKGCSFAGNKYARLEFEVSGYPNFSNDYDNILAESFLQLSIDATEFLLDNLRENILTN